MPRYEFEWTTGEEVVPGFLVMWSATIEADDFDEANLLMDELEREHWEFENLWNT
ncbi:hypothetical protein UG55_100744 [Frankia sp. EI5c]|uniref:hypothetical protein n=1 Tax=Frankia sp. EI5c TaxID=683316 RepID=UPI0007C2256F|nr:hypothetical protein [Frankia sp. EI5c]OAA27716.1 hypothetical protein UG55_100744 [Frankia sp. EI5c]